MTQTTLDFETQVCQFPTAKQLCITGPQMRLVYECFMRGGEYTFDDIRAYCKARGEMYRETSISARIRELNGRLASRRLEIKHRDKRKGSRDQIYRLESIH